MTFGRQKRLLLGALAFLAPVPLAFNEVLEWPFLAAYLLGVAYFLRRAWLDPPGWLRPWIMNLLALAYLPFFFFDLTVLGRGRLVGPVVHLGLFTVLTKLFSIRREKDKWQAAVGIFFLFLAAMATSVHPSIVLYLVVFLCLGLALLTRFAFLHILAGFGHRGEAGAPLPVRAPLGSFLAVAVVLTLVVAVPLFALLPRVRTPYIIGRGVGTGTTIEAMGFSDEVTLDSIGRVRSSREVALRIQYDDTERMLGRAAAMRFKAATFDVYKGKSWERTPFGETLVRGRGRPFRFSDVPPVTKGTVFLRPLGSNTLVLPVETVSAAPPTSTVDVGQGGAVSLRFRPGDVLEYPVEVAAEPVMLARPPEAAVGPAAAGGALDLSGVTPRMAELAARVMGDGADSLRAQRLEHHLMTQYDYTLDFIGRSTAHPLDDFLFRYRSGHCEYFASAMVLMLRSQGIPARLVTGFLGAEYNPLEGYFIVRQSNAHAWVEAYLGDLGTWRTFDPTPPAGRPTASDSALLRLASQAYDYLLFRWDRYVLTYGFYDQMRVFLVLRDLWHQLWHPARTPPHSATSSGGEEEEGEAAAVATAPAARSWPAGRKALLGVLAALSLLLAALLVRRYRSPLTATAAYRQLRGALSRAGLPLSVSDPPLALRRLARERYPAAAEPTALVVDRYVRESFGGRELAEEDRDELREALSEALRLLRKAG